mgnify:CR=1 FL=1
MTKINHIRIYPGAEGGFDILLRVRGGIVKHSNHPDIAAAITAAWALEGRKPGDSLYVYEPDFPSWAADYITDRLSRLSKNRAAGGSQE